MSRVRRGRAAGAGQLNQLISNPSALQKQVLADMERLEEARTKMDAVVKKYGGVQKIESLKAEAEKALEAANKEAAAIVTKANRQFTARENKVKAGEREAKERDAAAVTAAETRNEVISRRQGEADALKAEAKKLRDQATGLKNEAKADRAAAGKTQADADALLARLQAAKATVKGALLAFGD